MDRVITSANWVEIDLDALKYNYEGLRNKLSKDTKMCMVVKANGYGHGSVEMSKLYESLGADFLAVARSSEGLELRENGINLPILNLGFTNPNDYENIIDGNISSTIFDVETAEKLNEVASKINKIAKVHIKIDTGMSRLGFLALEKNYEKILKDVKYISELPNVKIEGIFTHFSTSDSKNKEFERIQLKRFENVIDMLQKNGLDVGIRHCSNSAEILDTDVEFDMVRPGIIQYGIYPSDEVNKTVDVKPVMSFKAKVTNVKILDPGTSISYGRTYFTTNQEKIASIAVGYADGFLRGRKNPFVYINGEKCPIVGRICMDQCMVRVPMDMDVKINDDVVLFGDGLISVTEIANSCDTIEHEVLCNINRRVPRIYKKDGEICNIIDYILK